MIGITTRRLSIALLAQVVFCLVAAPILAAEQWSAPVVAAEHNKKAPAKSGVTIAPAFDAANVRPELSTKDTKGTKKKSPSCPFVSFVDNSSFWPVEFPRWNEGPTAFTPLATPRQALPAFQPTGPPRV